MFIIVSRAGSSASKVIWLRACLSRFHSTSTVVKKNKVFPSSAEAVKDIPNGATILIGGFGPCGLPDNLLTAVKNAGPKKLHVIGNNAGTKDFGWHDINFSFQIPFSDAGLFGDQGSGLLA